LTFWPASFSFSPVFTEDIWAGTFGRHIRNDRTFFFGGYQYDVQRSSGPATAAAPSAEIETDSG
jgi:hypothetical protein